MNRSNRISAKTLYFMFLLFPLVKPDVNATATYFGSFFSEVIDGTFVLWQFISLGISLLTLAWRIVKKRKIAVKRYFIFECLLCIALTYSTVINSSMLFYRIVRELLPGFVFLLVMNNYSGNEVLRILKAFYYDLTLLMIVNSLFMYFTKPWQVNSGDAVYYLFGLDNYTFMVVFCAFSVGTVLSIVQNGRLDLKIIITYLFIDGAYFYTNATTAIVVSLMCIVLCIVYKTKIIEALNWKRVLIAMGLIFYVIVGSDFVASRFGSVFSILGKLPNFSGREHIWMIGFSLLTSKPLWGYGIDSAQISSLMISSGLSWEIGHLHNVILEYLVKGGFVGFCIFGFMWVVELYTNRENENKNKTVSSYIYALFLISFLMYMFEYRIADHTSWVFLVLIAEMGIIVERVKNITITADGL